LSTVFGRYQFRGWYYVLCAETSEREIEKSTNVNNGSPQRNRWEFILTLSWSWIWCTDTSDPRHFGTGAEVSILYFGTTVKIRDTSAPVPKCLPVPKCIFRDRLYFVHRSVTLIYLFNKDYFIDDL